MKLIVGLGNPGKKYEKTWHNLGFLVIDKLVKELDLMPFRRSGQFEASISQKGNINDRIIFAKPETFMNLSGRAVSKMINYYKIGTDDLIVISDDIDLPIGTIRIREEGSSGGHKGLDSVISEIGSEKFIRIRIGIRTSRVENVPTEKYVLEKVPKEVNLEKILDATNKLVLKSIKDEISDKTINVSL